MDVILDRDYATTSAIYFCYAERQLVRAAAPASRLRAQAA